MSGSLWVDDCKPCPDGYAVARTYDDALRLLLRYDYDELFLDHDLGEDKRTGYDLLMELIAADRVPERVECISWNPAGRKRILDALASIGKVNQGRSIWPQATGGPLNPIDKAMNEEAARFRTPPTGRREDVSSKASEK